MLCKCCRFYLESIEKKNEVDLLLNRKVCFENMAGCLFECFLMQNDLLLRSNLKWIDEEYKICNAVKSSECKTKPCLYKELS